MPRKLRRNKEHRIPVNDDELFEEMRNYALRHDLTWVDALRKLLSSATATENEPVSLEDTPELVS